jgi:hypothetical protein
MQKDMEKERRRTRELLLDRYVLALDEGDPAAAAAALDDAYEASIDDPEIERLINEINLAYRADAKLTPMDADAKMVRALLREHVPSAFDTHDQLKKRLTVGEVAGWLQAQGRVRAGDQEVNRSLLTNSTVLPLSLNAPAIKNLAIDLRVGGSQFYWRAFRDAAITIGISRSHDQAQLAARERQQVRRPPRRDKKK